MSLNILTELSVNFKYSIVLNPQHSQWYSFRGLLSWTYTCSLVLGVALFIAIRSRAGHTNNWHSIALTGSSPPGPPSGYRAYLHIFTLLGVEVIVVLSSLTLFYVQPRHPSKGSKTKQELAHFTKIQRSSSVEPDDHYPLTCTPENGVWMLGIWIPAVFCLCLEAKRRTRILWW